MTSVDVIGATLASRPATGPTSRRTAWRAAGGFYVLMLRMIRTAPYDAGDKGVDFDATYGAPRDRSYLNECWCSKERTLKEVDEAIE